jgi:hypothetical protein
MKKVMIALTFCAFAMGTVQAVPVQPEPTIQQEPDKKKETISVDQLPRAAQETIANRLMVVSQAYVITGVDGNTKWYKVKGTIDGEEKTLKFDQDGNVKKHEKEGEKHRNKKQ